MSTSLVMTAPGVQAESGRPPRILQPACLVTGPGESAGDAGAWASDVSRGGVAGAGSGGSVDADGAGDDETCEAAGVESSAVGTLASSERADEADGDGAVTAGGGAPPHATTKAERARRDRAPIVRSSAWPFDLARPRRFPQAKPAASPLIGPSRESQRPRPSSVAARMANPPPT